MPRFGILVVVISVTVWAQVPDVSAVPPVVSAANPQIGVAPGSIATVTGSNFSAETAANDVSPWPDNLGGVRIDVSDEDHMTRPAGLLYVSPSQINFEIPAGSAVGPATVIIRPATQKPIPIPAKIESVAPALYSVNGSGIAAATAARVLIPSGFSSATPVYSCFNPQSRALVPIDLRPDSNIYVTLRATGLNGVDTRNVKVNLGPWLVAPDFAGSDGVTQGLDRVRFAIPFAMRGAGEVSVSITAAGVTSNPVKLNIR